MSARNMAQISVIKGGNRGGRENTIVVVWGHGKGEDTGTVRLHRRSLWQVVCVGSIHFANSFV